MIVIRPTQRPTKARPRRRHTAAALVALATLTLSACAASSGGTGTNSNGTSGASGGGGTVQLGVIVAETGPIAGAGKTFANGGRIAMQEINDGDLIGNGTKIELVEKEGSEDPAKSASVMAQLASDKSITGIACCILSTVAGAAKPIAVKNNIPLMLWGATEPGLAEPRTCSAP